jgi:hypothetical protein
VKNSLTLLGVTLDNIVSYNKHVMLIVRTCNYYISTLQHIRPVLSRDIAHQISCSIVVTKLDYCNALLHNGADANLHKLQRVQNNLARTVCSCDRSTDAKRLLQELHWLPVEYRVKNLKVAKSSGRKLQSTDIFGQLVET